MTAPKVSVIIPAYRVEQYLHRCVDSVVAQSLRDIQIIIVNDGSPDRSPEICREYEKADPRVCVINKKNGGLASARNAGLRQANGEYIFFLDADDWIDPNTLEELYRIARSYQVDFVRFRPMTAHWPGIEDGTMCNFGNEECMKEGLFDRSFIEEVLLPRLFATPELQLGVIVAAWRSLYRRSFLAEHALCFEEEVRYSEDTLFSAKVVMAASKFYYLDGPRYYHYFYNPASITRSYREDRWEVYRKLIACFERDFSDNPFYDFTDQLWLQKLYCISSALGDCRFIEDKKKRKQECRKICDDPITRSACRHLNLLNTGWKNRLYFELVKRRRYGLISRNR